MMNHVFQASGGMKNHPSPHTFLLSLPILVVILFSGCDSQKHTITGHNDKSTSGMAEDQPENQIQGISHKGFDRPGKPISIQSTALDVGEIEKFFIKLGKASRSSGDFDESEFLSNEAVIQYIEANGILDNTTGSIRQQFVDQIPEAMKGFKNALRKNLAYDYYKIMRIDVFTDRSVDVHVRHYDNIRSRSSAVCWSLIKTDGGWRLYESENLEWCFPAILTIGVAQAVSLEILADTWGPDYLASTQGITSPSYVFTENSDVLTKLQTYDLPFRIKRFTHTSQSQKAIWTAPLMNAISGLDAVGEAIEDLNDDQTNNYASPMYRRFLAENLKNSENYNSALDELDQFVAEFGENFDTRNFRSEILYKLGRMNEAREEAILGLNDNPHSIQCLLAMILASTHEQLSENPDVTAGYFTGTHSPENTFRFILDFIINKEPVEKSRFLVDVLEQETPDSEMIPAYRKSLFLNGLNNEDFAGTLNEIDEYMIRKGLDTDLLAMKSSALISLGRLDEAQMAALTGLKEDPEAADCISCLIAASPVEHISHPSTLEHIRNSGDLEFTFENSLDDLVYNFRLPDKASALLRLYERSLPGSELIPDYIFSIIELHMELGNYSKAFADIENYIKRFGSDRDILGYKSNALLQLGRAEEAREAAVAGMKVNPDSVTCVTNLIAAGSPEQVNDPLIVEFLSKKVRSEYAISDTLDKLIEMELFSHARAVLDLLKNENPDSTIPDHYSEILNPENSQ